MKVEMLKEKYEKPERKNTGKYAKHIWLFEKSDAETIVFELENKRTVNICKNSVSNIIKRRGLKMETWVDGLKVIVVKK